MSADPERLQELARRVLGAWNLQDVQAVLACYTHDLVYLDPNTRGPVDGRDAMRSYLTKLFDRWAMQWEPGEIYPLDGLDGVAIRWSAALRPIGSGLEPVEVEGLDLVILRGDLVARNEVYFDRSALAAFLAPQNAA